MTCVLRTNLRYSSGPKKTVMLVLRMMFSVKKLAKLLLREEREVGWGVIELIEACMEG